jgi:2-C-methyl-D-erythritol 4-phosphate cytidylyltransferase
MTAFASCVIVAAGRGERFGASAKVLTPVGGRPVLAWVLDAIEAAGTIRDVVIVYGPHTEAPIRTMIQHGSWTKIATLVAGGAQR